MNTAVSEGVSGWRIEREYPPEAGVEQAIKVRPFFLKQDAVHHGKVTNAISGLAAAQDSP